MERTHQGSYFWRREAMWKISSRSSRKQGRGEISGGERSGLLSPASRVAGDAEDERLLLFYSAPFIRLHFKDSETLKLLCWTSTHPHTHTPMRRIECFHYTSDILKITSIYIILAWAFSLTVPAKHLITFNVFKLLKVNCFLYLCAHASHIHTVGFIKRTPFIWAI